MTEERVIDKIRGLLAKAEATEFEAEAEAFLDKAMELMARHRVDEALLAAADKASNDPVDRIILDIGAWRVPKGQLAVFLAKAFDCHVIWTHRKKSLAFVGHKSDLDMVQTLMTSLELQLDRELLNVRGYDKGETRAARSSFAYAWTERVGERIVEYYGRAVEDAVKEAEASPEQSSSVALALASRIDDVTAKYQEFYKSKPRYTSKSRHVSDYSASDRGYSAGNRADIGQGAVRGGNRQITS